MQQVAGSWDKEIGSLAKLALASIYQDTGKTQQAVDLYKALAEKPTTTVGKSTAEFELQTLRPPQAAPPSPLQAPPQQAPAQ